MREFWVRLVSMLAIVGVLLGYNSVLDARAKEDEIARLSAQVAGNGQSDSENGGSTNYKDGTYTGEADGFGGTIQVEVKIEKSKIAEINVISAEKEDGAYLSMAKDIIPKIIDAQSADIDTISGATFSSTGIKNASEQNGVNADHNQYCHERGHGNLFACTDLCKDVFHSGKCRCIHRWDKQKIKYLDQCSQPYMLFFYIFRR